MTTITELLQEIQKRIGVSRISEITHLDKFGLPVIQCFRPFSKYPVLVQREMESG
jgi:ribosomal protein S12 methylthiotransferase accessory factor YcaO